MSEEGIAGVPRSQQAEGLRKHYESVSLQASDWCNQIPVAIDLWERWPDLERQLAEAQEEIQRLRPAKKIRGSSLRWDVPARLRELRDAALVERDEAQGLAANLAQRLQEAKDRKVLLNGMTQEQKAAIFDIKAIVSDGVRHYAAILGEKGA